MNSYLAECLSFFAVYWNAFKVCGFVCVKNKVVLLNWIFVVGEESNISLHFLRLHVLTIRHK